MAAFRCPDCGTYNPSYAEVCKKCGATLITGPAPDKTTPPEKSARAGNWFSRLFKKREREEMR